MHKHISLFLKRNATGRNIFIVFFAFFISLAVSLKDQNVLSLLASATSSQDSSTTIVYLSPTKELVQVGDVFDVDVNINAAVPINVVGTTISYPTDLLSVVGISKSKTFLELWTEETVIREDLGQVHFSGGTTRKGGLVGQGTALTITMRAVKSGEARFNFLDTEVLASNGHGDQVDTDLRPLALLISDTSPITSNSIKIDSSTPSSDERTSLLDLSVLTIHLFGPYDVHYDINKDGVLNLGDLSAFFAKLKIPGQ